MYFKIVMDLFCSLMKDLLFADRNDKRICL